MMLAAKHRGRRRARGNAVIEFAIGFGVIFFCLSGVVQFGYSMYIYNCLEAAVAGAAAHASRATLDTSNGDFETGVKNMVVYGNLSGEGPVLVPGLQTSQVSVARTPAEGVPDRITVGITSVTVNAIFRSFTFTGKPKVTVRFSGKYRTS